MNYQNHVVMEAINSSFPPKIHAAGTEVATLETSFKRLKKNPESIINNKITY